MAADVALEESRQPGKLREWWLRALSGVGIGARVPFVGPPNSGKTFLGYALAGRVPSFRDSVPQGGSEEIERGVSGSLLFEVVPGQPIQAKISTINSIPTTRGLRGCLLYTSPSPRDDR